ncbi:LacI family transcriptional regulator [Donghicola sp. C2-DW-16]|uniref:LacI family transcriptional regulator n=1 Tax=Donghicola mangrovi TaxID=2729614 RepID=A0A850QAG2_9RHOB|nr:substrate-binding domain-containing protein [Donghicola mangrovi]NVO25292.1 LacI family transcriptional regulator [Donghicola mangrovi]NVO27263.1 LacI family transcriptional regulator [Donghicola mangrovi]
MSANLRKQPQGLASAAEVARLAGVSRSAVSRTFTDGASVSAKTREKVLAAAKELNYHVNHLARGISKAESRPVCLLASNMTKPYHGLLLDAITRELQAAGRMAMVINVTADPESAQAALEQALSYRASASVVMSGTPPEAMVSTCIDAGQRVILINRSGGHADADHIRIDYQAAMDDAVFMLKRAGCERLALAGSAKGTPSLMERERLFLEAAAKQGYAPRTFKAPNSNYDDGAQAARALLAGRDRPDGVFCLTDLMACGLIDSARLDFGLKVPTDLNVIGFDNIPQAAWAGYGLTTFAQPYEEIARTVVRIVADETPAQVHSLPTAAQWRQSVLFGPAD